jgi:peroxiredoxin
MHAHTKHDSNAFMQAMDEARCHAGISLSEWTHDSPTLVVFLRHAGCSFCREALSDLAAARASIEQGGVRICLVHMGPETQARTYFADYHLDDVPRISDPERRLYRAFGLERGRMRQLFGPAVIRRGIEAAAHGHVIGTLAGDGFQMPGVFLVHKGAILRAFRHETAADRPDYQELACGIQPKPAQAG